MANLYIFNRSLIIFLRKRKNQKPLENDQSEEKETKRVRKTSRGLASTENFQSSLPTLHETYNLDQKAQVQSLSFIRSFLTYFFMIAK